MSESSRLLGLADSLVAALNAAQPVQPDPPAEPLPSPFVLPFTAVRKVVPLVDLDQMGETLTVFVVGVGPTEERYGGLDSGLFTGNYDVDILVQQRLAPAADLEARGADLVLLTEQIRDLLKTGDFAAGDARGVLVGIDANPAYSLKALLERRCFVGVQTLTFRVFV